MHIIKENKQHGWWVPTAAPTLGLGLVVTWPLGHAPLWPRPLLRPRLLCHVHSSIRARDRVILWRPVIVYHWERVATQRSSVRLLLQNWLSVSVIYSGHMHLLLSFHKSKDWVVKQKHGKRHGKRHLRSVTEKKPWRKASRNTWSTQRRGKASRKAAHTMHLGKPSRKASCKIWSTKRHGKNVM